MLADNTSLKCFKSSENLISSESALLLLKSAKSLQAIELRYNLINNDACTHIIEILKKKNLQVLDLEGNMNIS